MSDFQGHMLSKYVDMGLMAEVGTTDIHLRAVRIQALLHTSRLDVSECVWSKAEA